MRLVLFVRLAVVVIAFVHFFCWAWWDYGDVFHMCVVFVVNLLVGNVGAFDGLVVDCRSFFVSC